MPYRGVSLHPRRGMSNQRPAPPIDYRELKQLVTNQGLLAPQNGYYAFKAAAALTGIALAVWVTLAAGHFAIVLLGALLLAFASTQVALLGHDVGHRQGFRGHHTNHYRPLCLRNLLLGISHTWWSNNTPAPRHPNHIDLDPDIQFPMVVLLDRAARVALDKAPAADCPAGVHLPHAPAAPGGHMRITSIQHLPAAARSGRSCRRP